MQHTAQGTGLSTPTQPDVRRLAVVFLACLGVAFPALAQSGGIVCAGRAYTRVFNDVELRSLKVRDGVGYAVGEFSSLLVIDFSDPMQPSLLSRLSLPGSNNFLDVEGDTVYITNSENEVKIIDVSDPEDPAVIGTAPLMARARSLTVSAGIAYVGAGWNGFWAYDLSDPQNPLVLGNTDTPGLCVGVIVQGTLAYTIEQERWMGIYDVSDPGSGERLGQWQPWENEFYHVDVVDGIAYISCWAFYSGGGSESLPTAVQIVDVSNPAAPFELGLYSLSDDPMGVRDSILVDGDRAYVARRGGMEVFGVNLSDFTNPKPIGYYGAPFQAGLPISDLTMTDAGLLSNHGNEGVWLLDTSAPLPGDAVIGVNSDGVAQGGYNDLAITGDTAFITAVETDGFAELRAVDIADPESPTTVDSFIPQDSGALDAAGSFVYFAERNAGLRVFEFVNDELVERGFLAVGGSPKDVAFDGTHAHIGLGSSGLRIVDVSDPDEPVEVFSSEAYTVDSVALVDGLAFLTNRNELITLDVSDVNDVRLLSRFRPPEDRSGDLSAAAPIPDSTLLYVPHSGDGINLIDVADPGNPAVVGVAPVIVPMSVVRGSLLYTGGATVYDVSDLEDPLWVGHYELADVARPVIRDGVGYFLDRERGLYILNISDCPCPGDFNGDGAVDTLDVLDFLNAWSSGEPEADFNGDGVIDTADVLAFLNAWNSDC